MSADGAPPRHHLQPVPPDEPPFDPAYDAPQPRGARQDLAAERALIAAALHHPNPAELADLVRPSDFFSPWHETVWTAWHHLVDASDTTPDAVLLNAQLVKAGDRSAVQTLADILTDPALPALASHYAQIVRDQSRLRTVDHLGTKLRQIASTGTADDIERVMNDAFDTLEDALTHWGPTATTATPHTWAPVDLAPVLSGEFLDPPPTMLTRTDGVPLLYDGAVHTISGESESGKTWLTLVAAVQLLAAGHRVTFIDFEDRADRVIARLLALGAYPQHIRDHFAYVRPDRPLDNDGRRQLEPALHNVRLVILDGVTEAMTIHGYDLNSNSDSALFQALLPRWVADHGPAVVLIDHVVKDKEKQDRFALGAQHKLAGIDGAAYIVKVLEPFGRGKLGRARVDVAKDRPGHVRGQAHGRSIAEFTLDATRSDEVLTYVLDPAGTHSGRAGDTFEPTVLMERVSRYVQANPGMTKKAIEGAMNGKATTIRLAVELLVTRGYVGVKSGPRGAVQHFHQKAYYSDPDNDPENDSEPTSNQQN